jgi:hypothetical protein
MISMDVKKASGDDPALWSPAFDSEIVQRRSMIDASPLGAGLEMAWAAATVTDWTAELAASIDNYLNLPDQEPRPTEFVSLAELALWTLLKRPNWYLDDTGLVFAGFGDHDVFPCHVHYRSNGLVNGKHLAQEVGRQAITHAIPADLSAFAQTGMIDTFQLGLDMSVYTDAMVCLDVALDEFAAKVIGESGGDPAQVPNLGASKEATRASFAAAWQAKTRTAHAYPLRRVLSALPINEMAELAETLVNLQSLKEKVTKPSEEVGGPIDVAVITKNEGLVWIRRKHYFKPELNVRYVARLGALYS